MTGTGEPGDAAERPSADVLYDHAPCGYITTDHDGVVQLVNRTLLEWTGFDEEHVVGKRFVDLLAEGSRIFHETHYRPLLHANGEVREVALDMRRADGGSLPVLVNSMVDDVGMSRPGFRTTVFDATLRHEYEQELVRARKRAEASERAIRQVSLELQDSMLRSMPLEDARFSVESRYLPAVATLEVGGDWHDAFLLPGEDVLALSVGDVVGKGIDAAGAMGQLRSGLRALAMGGGGPAAVLGRLDQFATTVPNAMMATAVYAEIDLRSGSVRMASAGHPPAIVVRPGRAPEFVSEGRSLPIQVVLEVDRPEATFDLPPGSSLFLYTDGLIERRLRSIDEGMDRLAEVIGLACASGEPVADAVLNELLDVGERDDVCILHVTRH